MHGCPLTRVSCAFAIAAAFLLPQLRAADEGHGAIKGVTRGADKQRLPQAQVVLHSVEENTDRRVLSSSDGVFSIEGLKPGHYELTARKPGVQSSAMTAVEVGAGDALVLNLTLGAPLEVARPAAVDKPALENREIASTSSLYRAALALGSEPASVVTVASTTAPPAAPLAASAENLEAAVEAAKTASTGPSAKPADADPPLVAQATPPATPAPGTPDAGAPAAPPPVDNDTPFAFADFTWMLSNPRNHDEVLDGKYFSGEFRVDTNYMYDYSHPIDHTLGGTTEGERTGEFVIQALGIGGDFHAGNMQGRILTQFGAVSTAVPRNDASYSLGQWQLNDAYRYLTEMYAGYHINYKHGLNFQVGDFLSFIGLFSYYSFDNWTYQPSYVSSNTPWFFTGMRAQFFPTNKLKIEPWLINGWQTYAKYNGREGVGGQVLWRPTGNWDFVWNTYTLGRDVLGNPHRSRYHADWSQEWKFYEKADGKGFHRAAMTVTEDFGCESGGGVTCLGGHYKTDGTPAQNFIGIMAYQRLWLDTKERFAFSYGGGVISNPGRYLVLLPPINGATATTGTPYFSENPGDPYKAYDFQLSFDYMPSQWVTWKVEFTQRGASVPYFTGPGGVTPQVTPGLYVNTGDPTAIIPGFTPDLRKQERRWIFSLMVKL
ncbi:MAG TPA: TonB-dependent receptor [Bryobacteraceae bacterium]|nr:TonB-dependent receptor [Bryobacteraceae bacterium]